MTPVKMSLHYVSRVLASLPPHVNVVITMDGREQILMTRGLPADDRRLTNITTGREWSLPLTDAIDVRAVYVPELRLEVEQ